MSKLIVQIMGGIGNQLFTYAAARRLALVNHCELVIDDVTGFEHDLLYKRKSQMDKFNISCRTANNFERMEPFSRVRNRIKQRINSYRSFTSRHFIFQESCDFDVRLLSFKLQGTTYLHGYWQSENYFKDIETTIRSDLKIKPPLDQINLGISKRINFDLAIAIHLRTFDKQNNDSIYNIKKSYYIQAIQRMESIAPGGHYYIFSEQQDLECCFNLPSDRITYVSHNIGDENAYADL